MLASAAWPIAAVLIAIVLGVFGTAIAPFMGKGGAATMRQARAASTNQLAIIEELGKPRADVDGVRAQLTEIERLLRSVE